MDRLVNKIICGDASKILRQFPSEFIECVVTSPPYWALRDYGVDGQLGLEETSNEYIIKLCNIFDEVKRVLKKTGTCWVNLGDTYGGSNCGYGQSKESSGFQNVVRQNYYATSKNRPLSAKVMPKSLIMIPFRFAIEMANRGWILRNTIIWHKPNCIPSSVKDRFTVDFEYVFFFVKNKKYWFEQQFEPHISENQRTIGGKKYAKIYGHKTIGKIRVNPFGKNKRCVWKIDNGQDDRITYLISQLYEIKKGIRGKQSYEGKSQNLKGWNEALNNAKAYREGLKILQQQEQLTEQELEFLKDYVQNHFGNPQGRNKRCVWTINTKPFPGAHFATFPEQLVEPMIKAGCPEFICMRCEKAREKLFKGKSSAAFNIRVRDVKEGRIKHTDRKASSKEVRDYEERTYGGKGKKFIGYTDCGCNAGFKPGIVLDPFAGSGTTLLVAKKLGRNYIGVDISPDYVKMGKERIDGYSVVRKVKKRKEK